MTYVTKGSSNSKQTDNSSSSALGMQTAATTNGLHCKSYQIKTLYLLSSERTVFFLLGNIFLLVYNTHKEKRLS